MLRPAHFGFNPETAQNNVFQQRLPEDPRHLQSKVLQEFDQFVKTLENAGIYIDILEDDPDDQRLDAIYANNWFSTHPNNTLVTYPMFSPIRRKERDPRHINYILKRYEVHSHIALEHFESTDLYLEGTGSLIIDHEYGVVYGNRSPRTHDIPFHRFCQLMGYTPVLFDAFDQNNIPVYHTNVVMGIGDGYIMINQAAIPPEDWVRLNYYFHYTNKTVIEIDHRQMAQFLGNVAFLHNSKGEPFIAMSDTAYKALTQEQKVKLSTFGTILHSDLSTIEKVGGGSAKCMIAENYLKFP